MPLSPTSARAFADRWYHAWNTSDLDAIMACYHPDIQHSSPYIARFNGTPDAWLRGLPAVREYFARAFQRNPTPPDVTRFSPLHLTIGHESVILIYRRMTSELAAEIFFLDGAHQITRSISHYEDTTR